MNLSFSDKPNLTNVCIEGGFKASVTVRGVEFQCSFEGRMCSSPSEARESAALQMLINLRSMAKSEQ